MISVSDLVNSITSQGSTVRLKPTVLGLATSCGADNPELAFLGSDIVVGSAAFDRDKLLLTGSSDLAGVGSGPVRLLFLADETHMVARVCLYASSVGSLIENPFVTQLLGKIPAVGDHRFVSLTVECDMAAQTNRSHLGIGIKIPALTPDELVGEVVTLTTERAVAGLPTTYTVTHESAGLHTPAATRGGSGQNPASAAAWANVPATLLLGPLQNWLAGSLVLTWGPGWASFSLFLKDDTPFQAFGITAKVGLTFSATYTGPQHLAVWEVSGTLRAPLPGGTGKDIVIGFDTTGTGSGRTVTFTATFDAGGGITLADLAGAIQAIPFLHDFPDVTSLLPDALRKDLAGLSARGFSVVFDLTKLAVIAMGIEIDSTARIEIVKDYFTIEEIRLWFVDTASQGTAGGLEAVCLIGDSLTLDATATFPRNLLTLTVRDSLDLDGFDASGKLPLPSKDGGLTPKTAGSPITLHGFEAVCDLRDRSYSAYLDLGTSLTLAPFFTLHEIQAALTYSTASNSETLQATGTLLNAPATLTIQHDKDTWNVQGELLGLDVGNWLHTNFTGIPAPLLDIDFETIRFAYTSTDKNLTLSCYGKLLTGQTRTQFQADITHTGNGLTRETRNTEVKAKLTVYT